MSNKRRTLMAAAGAGGAGEYVDDLFSTYLYPGSDSDVTITNGIDLDGEGGMVWIKSRGASNDNYVADTERHNGTDYGMLGSNLTAAETFQAGVKSVSSTGFVLDGNVTQANRDGHGPYVSWTFREAPGFFDIVTYTGNGSAQTIAHNLESVPGMIIVKNRTTATNWETFHQMLTADNKLELNGAGGSSDNSNVWNDTAPTSTHFTVGTNNSAQNNNYVAYLFANDAEVFGADGDESIIKCGGFTTDGSGNATVSLGWEPQYIITKKTSGSRNWQQTDIMRGRSGTSYYQLHPNLNNDEGSSGPITQITATGFVVLDGASSDYVYMAIRRPMKVPEAATEVFAMDTGSGADPLPTFDAPFPVDFEIEAPHGGSDTRKASARLTGGVYWKLNGSAISVGGEHGPYGNYVFDSMVGWGISFGSTMQSWMFKRAAGFFDVVGYTGTGSAHTEAHNLTVAPEMIFVKPRDEGRDWRIYHAGMTNDCMINLNLVNGKDCVVGDWNNTDPTASVFSLGSVYNTNRPNYKHIALLFATLAGISKVGTYTGTAATLNLDMGFAAGARFFWTKRTDASGDWYLYDTQRGIVTGNDPYLITNTDATPTTGTDYVDPYNAGLTLTAAGSSTINISSASYIFLAIA